MARLLLLEDEPLIAEMLVSWARELGCEIIGPTASSKEALALIEEGSVDLALLDICVADGDSYPVAEHLKMLGVPFLFATGLSDTSIDPIYAHVPVAPKPFEFDQLRSALFAIAPPHCAPKPAARKLGVATSE